VQTAWDTVGWIDDALVRSKVDWEREREREREMMERERENVNRGGSVQSFSEREKKVKVRRSDSLILDYADSGESGFNCYWGSWQRRENFEVKFKLVRNGYVGKWNAMECCNL
jgi:hypothetical protein